MSLVWQSPKDFFSARGIATSPSAPRNDTFILEVITMKLYTVAVLGATGAVGQEMINILQERNFPVGKLIPLASARSAG